MKIEKISSFIRATLIFVLLLVAGLAAVSALDVPGNYKILVVQSGSMEPGIKRMGIVVVKPSEKYREGDVITVSDPGNSKVSVTHRVVEVGEDEGRITYVTKGDANEDADTEKRLHQNVLGKVILALPFLGYPISFAKTQTGLIVMIIIPAAIIVYSELISIKNETLRLLSKRKKRKLSLMEKAEVAVGEEIIEVENEIKEVETEIKKAISPKKKRKKNEEKK